MTELRRLSHSQAQMYLRCPRQYEFRYLQGLKAPPGAALVKGRAYDFVANANYTEKIKTGKDVLFSEWRDLAAEGWKAAIDDAGGEVNWGRGDASSIQHELSGHIVRFFADIAPNVHPVAVQQQVEREGWLAFIDVIDDETRIRDNKAKGKMMGSNEAHKDLQPTAYAYALDASIDFVFDVTTPNKAASLGTSRDMADVAAYARLVELLRAAIDTGIFLPNPTSNLCSPTWCGFWDRCDHGGTRWFTAAKEGELIFTG